jgi:hypothetical protein
VRAVVSRELVSSDTGIPRELLQPGLLLPYVQRGLLASSSLGFSIYKSLGHLSGIFPHRSSLFATKKTTRTYLIVGPNLAVYTIHTQSGHLVEPPST